MKPIEWFFEQAWRRAAGLPERAELSRPPSLEELRRTQWNAQFERLMRNRLVMGAFRYGTLDEQTNRRHDNAGSIRRHLEAYEETGNQEHLVDVANLALVEFTRPANLKAHWASIDDGDHHAAEVPISGVER